MANDSIGCQIVDSSGIPVGSSDIISKTHQAGYGTATQVMTSNGSGIAMTWQTPANPNWVTNGITNNYYAASGLLNNGSTTTTFTNITGNIYFLPFFVTNTTVYKTINIYCVLGVAASNITLGLYNSLAGNTQPTGSPIANSTSGNIASTASTTLLSYTFAATITLAPGVYWVAFAGSSSTSTFTGFQAGQYGFLCGLGETAVNTADNQQVGWYQAVAYNGTLPSVGSLSALTAASITPGLYIQAN